MQDCTNWKKKEMYLRKDIIRKKAFFHYVDKLMS